MIMIRVSHREFEKLVLRALDGLPAQFKERLDNVDIVVDDWPSPEEIRDLGLKSRHDLFGLYQGIPLTERSHYDMVLPDCITIYRNPLQAACSTRGAMVEEIRATVIHELAHHFGIDDSTLEHTDYR